MKPARFVLLLLSLASSVVLGTEKAFTELDDKTFTDFVTGAPVAFVDFYADWCSHCKAFEPVFEQVAEHFKGKIPVGRINAPNYMEFSTSQGIKALPTLRLYVNGEVHDYHGSRKFESVVDFIDKSTSPIVHELKSVEEINDFMTNHPLNFIGCFDESDADAKELYRNVAKSTYLIVNNAYFGMVPAHLKDALKIQVTPSILARSIDFAPTELEVTPDVTEDNMTKWIVQRSLPAFGEITEENIMLYYGTGLPMMWVVMRSPNDAILEWAHDLAIQYLGKMTFFWLDNFNENDQSKLLGYTYRGPYPAAVITQGRDRYVLPPLTALKFSYNTLKDFVDSFLEGRIHRQRSQPIPDTSENEGKLIKRLVGYNFEDVIFNPAKDVVVLFYQSDCSYCPDIRPFFEEVAKRLQYVDSLVFAEFDQAFNDVPDYAEIRMYPSVAFFPLNSKDKPTIYMGDKDPDELVKFLHSNVGIKFEYDEYYGDVDDEDVEEESNTLKVDEEVDTEKDEL